MSIIKSSPFLFWDVEVSAPVRTETLLASLRLMTRLENESDRNMTRPFIGVIQGREIVLTHVHFRELTNNSLMLLRGMAKDSAEGSTIRVRARFSSESLALVLTPVMGFPLLAAIFLGPKVFPMVMAPSFVLGAFGYWLHFTGGRTHVRQLVCDLELAAEGGA